MNIDHYIETIDAIINKIIRDDKKLNVSWIWQELHDRVNEFPDDFVLRSLKDAFGYHMQSTGEFEPMWISRASKEHSETEGLYYEVYPQRIELVEDNVLLEWEKLANSNIHSIVKARLADLLLAKKYNMEERRWHQIVIYEYIKLGQSEDVEICERGEYLIRANDVSKKYNQSNNKVMDAAIKYIQEVMETPEYLPGAIRRGLQVLIVNGNNFSETLDLIYTKYSLTQFDSLLNIKNKSRGHEENKKSLAKKMINEYIQVVDTSTDTRKSTHYLDIASEIARRANIKEEEVDLDDQPDQDFFLDAKLCRYITIEQKEITRVLDELVIVNGRLGNIIRRFGSYFPSPGNTSDCKLGIVFRNTLNKSFPVPPEIDIPTTGKLYTQKIELATIKWFAGTFGKQVLDIIPTSKYKYAVSGPNMPTFQEKLKSLFIVFGEQCNGHDDIIAQRADIIMESVDLWLDNKPTPASILILPMIEDMIKIYAISKIGKYKDSSQTNEHIGISGILRNLKKYDKDNRGIYRYWEILLVDHEGFNIRNDILHGKLPPVEGCHDQPSKNWPFDLSEVKSMPTAHETYVLLFHIACMLVFLADANYEQSR